jgi:hypothetical protein
MNTVTLKDSVVSLKLRVVDIYTFARAITFVIAKVFNHVK